MSKKAKALLKEEFGDDTEVLKEYYYIDLLGTHPEAQGQGYGSALMNTVLFSVSILRTWLFK